MYMEEHNYKKFIKFFARGIFLSDAYPFLCYMDFFGTAI